MLLPNHDITLDMWGSGIHTLFAEAKTNGFPSSPVRKAISDKSHVFQYDAPDYLGSGTITVILHGDSKNWDSSILETSPIPDALIALNAGLGSYQAWIGVIRAAHVTEIPFAVTEYSEQSAETQVTQVSIVFARSYG